MLYVLIGSALVFTFLNGFHDSSNIVATVISSRAMRPRAALYLTAAAQFVAPLLFGVAVANTVGKGLIAPETVSLTVVLAAVLAAILWSLLTWWWGIPSSSSHALIGGLLGAAILSSGLGAVQWKGLITVLVALFLSPILGLVFGFVVMQLVLYSLRNATPRVNVAFKRMQIGTSLALALSHGSNDAQKTMGIIALGLLISGFYDTFQIPLWIILSCSTAMALGTATGGWRLIHTLGRGIYRIRPVHAFTSQIASALIIFGAALLGGPVSTTQVVSSAIMGTGAAERVNQVRWQVAGTMLFTWFSTIPVTALVSALVYLLLQEVLI